MSLLASLQKLIGESLALVRSDPNHYLPREMRQANYNSFGTLYLGFQAYGWLAIIAARKVQPIWEERSPAELEQFVTVAEMEEIYQREDLALLEEIPDVEPASMLSMAEDYLRGRVTKVAVQEALSGRFYDGIMGLERVTTWPTYNAIDTCYLALNSVLFDLPVRGGIEEPALIAYAGVDDNPPGTWEWLGVFRQGDFQAYLKHDEITADINHTIGVLMHGKSEFIFQHEWQGIEHETVRDLRNLKPFAADLTKALEFWEWWLTEAIPQAWELVESQTGDS